VRFCRS